MNPYWFCCCIWPAPFGFQRAGDLVWRGSGVLLRDKVKLYESLDTCFRRRRCQNWTGEDRRHFACCQGTRREKTYSWCCGRSTMTYRTLARERGMVCCAVEVLSEGKCDNSNGCFWSRDDKSILQPKIKKTSRNFAHVDSPPRKA